MNSLLLIYYIIYALTAFAWPTWRLWKSTGINGLVLPRDDSAHGVIGLWFKGLMVATFTLVCALAFGLSIETLGSLSVLRNNSIIWGGVLLLAGSLIWIVIAQMHMGKAWRIGIDASAQPDLIATGLFKFTRNPIFLGMRINLLGLFLVNPCAPSLAILLVSEALIGVQVRLEEQYLSDTLGEAYQLYKRTTPRWL